MQNEYVSLKGAAVSFTDTKEQIIESELSLPDYYPEISRVLRCSVTTGVEEVTIAGDKVSVAGKADIRLLYLDADRHIHMYTSLAKYTCLFSGDSLQSEDTCFVSQSITGIEYRAGAPRKCEVRAVAAIRVLCVRPTEYTALLRVGAEDAEVCGCETELFGVDTVRRFELAFSESVELPSVGSRITGAVYSSQDIRFAETKVIKNKIMLKGCCELKARFVTEEGTLTQEVAFSLPFTEIMAAAGAEEDDECVLCADSACARIAPNEDGRNAQVFISAQVRAVCGSRKSYTLPEDIYSVRNETQLKRTDCRLITDFIPVERSFRVSSDAECYEDTASGISAFFTDAPVCRLIACNGVLHLNGSVRVNFLVPAADGELSLISRSCNFDEDTGIPAGGEGFTDCSAEITAASLQNGRIDYTVCFDTRGYLVKCEEKNLITDVSFGDGTDRRGSCEKIVLYYARPGERIWDIAKENGCSAGRIREFNELEGETVEESRMLVLIK